jgi:hypothetical protein
METNVIQHDEADARPGDLLVGRDAIRDYLVSLGMPGGTDVYYLKRAGHWPIGKTAGDGGQLVASKRRLARHAARITRGSASAENAA